MQLAMDTVIEIPPKRSPLPHVIFRVSSENLNGLSRKAYDRLSTKRFRIIGFVFCDR
ncbi:MAG: hypothetical protein ACKO3K_17195 [Cuspidothrix sp.]